MVTNHIFKTLEFDKWFSKQQPKLRVMINSRLDLLSMNHFGDYKIFDNITELKWKNGTRVYLFKYKSDTYIVLAGGNKNGQSRDIKKAKKIREEIIEGTYTF